MSSDTTIRPIETLYKGYRFRSRLEARWAVFLDACKQHYIYEHEGYRLKSGWYLPDFFLPERNSMLEVKSAHLYPANLFDDTGDLVHDDFPRELVLMHELNLMLKLDHPVVVYGDPVDVIYGCVQIPKEVGGAISIDLRGRTHPGIGIIDYFAAGLWDEADAARAARFERGD